MFRHYFALTYRLQSAEEANAARAEYRRRVSEIEEDIDLVQRYEDEALVRLDEEWWSCLEEWAHEEATVRALTRWGAKRRARRMHADAEGVAYVERAPMFPDLQYRLDAWRCAHDR